MFKQRLIWEDFNGKSHQEDFYFNMLVPEFADLNFSTEVGKDLGAYMREGLTKGNGEVIYTMFRLLVSYSYGRRSDDGSEFLKDPEWTKKFLASRAWEQMFLWLTEPGDDWKNAGAFWEGIFPEAMRDQVEEVQKGNTTGKAITEMTKEELMDLYNKTLLNKNSANA